MLAQVDPTVTMGYLVLGYGVMWLIALFYVLSLAWRQRNMRRDVALLVRLLEEGGDRGGR